MKDILKPQKHQATWHFVWQRLTALSNIGLTLWFLYFVFALQGKNYTQSLSLFESKWVVLLFSVFIGFGVFHMKLGCQMVIDDYCASWFWNKLFHICNVVFCVGVFVLLVFCLSLIAFGAF